MVIEWLLSQLPVALRDKWDGQYYNWNSEIFSSCISGTSRINPYLSVIKFAPDCSISWWFSAGPIVFFHPILAALSWFPLLNTLIFSACGGLKGFACGRLDYTTHRGGVYNRGTWVDYWQLVAGKKSRKWPRIVTSFLLVIDFCFFLNNHSITTQ